MRWLILTLMINSYIDGSGLRVQRTGEDVTGSICECSIEIDGPSGHAQCEWPSSHPSKPKLHQSTRLPSPQLLALRLKWGFSLVAQAHCLLVGG